MGAQQEEGQERAEPTRDDHDGRSLAPGVRGVKERARQVASQCDRKPGGGRSGDDASGARLGTDVTLDGASSGPRHPVADGSVTSTKPRDDHVAGGGPRRAANRPIPVSTMDRSR